jgi:hypothetical protein
VDEREVREGLREIADQALVLGVEFFGRVTPGRLGAVRSPREIDDDLDVVALALERVA